MNQILTTPDIQTELFPTGLHGQNNRITSFWVFAFVLLFVLSTYNIATAAPAENAGPPPLVTVVEVTEQNVNPQTEYVGHVEAIQAVDLQARVSGYLEKINFEEGSDVQAGSLLYLIEQAPYKLQVAVSRARLVKAEAAATSTRQHLQRIQAVKVGGVSITDLEEAEAAAQQAEAGKLEAQAILNLTKLDFDYTQITAPISGRIGATSLTVGNLTGPNSGPLARIVQLDPIRVLFSLSENELSAVKRAQNDATEPQQDGIMQPRLKLSDGSFFEQSGRIDFVDNRVDPTTGTIAVRALFDNPDRQLLPGQYVRVVVSQAAEKKRPVIPQSAILVDREGRYLLLVDAQSQVELRRITTGAVLGSLQIVESGLVAGEQVIVQGVQKVQPGQTVKTTTADATRGTDR
jgi:membrane fusion protein (multidrug efflux system)